VSAIAVFIGAPGAGKTKTGKRVAKALGVPHIDTDKVIVAEHGPIPEIFAEHGEAHFRRLEREAVVAALAQDAIVSLGGGAVLDSDTQADLAEVPVVLLTVSVDGIKARLAEHPDAVQKRPLLADGGFEAWERLAVQRRPIYEGLADLVVDTSHRTFDAVAEEVVEWLRRR